jgi:hypothetical protein
MKEYIDIVKRSANRLKEEKKHYTHTLREKVKNEVYKATDPNRVF